MVKYKYFGWIFWVWLVLFFGSSAVSVHAGLIDTLPKHKVAVVIHTRQGTEGYEKTAETKLEEILLDNKIKVLDRKKAEELRKKWGDLENPDYVITAEDFLEAGDKYEIGVLIRGYLVSESRRNLGGYFSATAQISLEIIDEEANVIKAQTSVSLGTPRFPPSDGLTESAAIVNAIQRAVCDAFEKMQFKVLNPPIPRRLSFNLTKMGNLPVKRWGISTVAVHPRLSFCYVGYNDGSVELYDLQTLKLQSVKNISRNRIVAFRFSQAPEQIFAFDKKGNVYQLSEKLKQISQIETKLLYLAAVDVSKDAEKAVLIDSRGKFAIVDLKKGIVNLHFATGIRNANQITLSPEADRMYISSKKGCYEVRFGDGNTPSLPKELISSVTGRTWRLAEIQSQAVSPDGQMLAVAILTKNIDLLRNRRIDSVEIKLLDLGREEIFASLKPRSHVTLKPKDVTGLTFGPDWRFLLAGSKDGRVRIWDTERGQQIQDLGVDNDSVKDMCFGAQGQLLLVHFKNGLWVWKIVGRK